MTIPRDNLDALTGLRFIAAFVIVLGHYHRPWLELTGIGMPLFFTLSGFIIHYVYADAFAGPWRRAAGEFAVARFSRIFPLYLALLLVPFTRADMGPILVSGENIPVLLAYWAGVWTWYPFQVDGHLLLDWSYNISWSVSTELFFYVAYAAVLYRLAGLRDIRRCRALLIGLCIVAYAAFYVAYQTRDAWEAEALRRVPSFVPRTENFTVSFYRWLLYMSPYARIFEFIGGVLTCQLFRLTTQRRSLARPLHAGAMGWIAIAMIAILWGLFRYFGGNTPWLAAGNHSFSGYIVSLHMNFLLAPACYLLIYSLAVGGTAIGRVLASRPALFLGDISYSTYLSHPLAERMLMRTGLVVTSTTLHLIAILVVIYGMSWVLYTVIEAPAKRWLRRLLRPRRLPVPMPRGTG